MSLPHQGCNSHGIGHKVGQQVTKDKGTIAIFVTIKDDDSASIDFDNMPIRKEGIERLCRHLDIFANILRQHECVTIH